MSTPVFLSTTYELDAAAYADLELTGGYETWWYTRLGNPTTDAVAARVAALEGAEDAIALASGMAAITATLLAHVPVGGRVVAARDLYGDAFKLLRDTVAQTRRTVVFVPIDDLAGWERALSEAADLVYVETLSNPMLRVADLPALARLAHGAGALAVVDATFSTPINVRPAEHGFDLVVQSATKYLNGHSDLIAGVVSGRTVLIEPIRPLAATLGGCIDPGAAARLDRGIKTLALRMERHNSSALSLARWLSAAPEVEHVSYPLLDAHPDFALAQELLAGGSGIVTFRVTGGDERAGRMMAALELILEATSLGGVETLICAPHNTSHLGLDSAQLAALGILPGTVRLSVGIEDPEDLIEDLERALAAS